MAQANNYYTTIKIIYNTSKSYDLLLQDIRQNMMGRHVESEAWGGMRRVGRSYLSCSGDGVSVRRGEAAELDVRNPSGRRGEATALDVRRPSGTNPLRFFSVYARNIYIQLSRRPRFFSLSRSWRPIFVSRRQRGALDPK